MELVRETRWTRHYSDELLGVKLVESKFTDGSAIITLDELKEKWSQWKPDERNDFCHAINEAKFDYLADIYRFVMAQEPDIPCWSAIAAWVVRRLPEAEYTPWLVEACLYSPPGKGEKLYQALALSKTDRARTTLRKCLDRAWNDPNILRSEGYIDDAAMDATVCLESLLQMGEKAPDFADKYRVLSAHNITVNRASAVSRLGMYFQ